MNYRAGGKNKMQWPCAVSVTMIILGLSMPVNAQVIDYGSLQTIFGEPITTSATGTPQRASEVPANMTIISADEIRRAGIRNIPQIIGMYVPGIDILQEGVSNFDVGVRGYQQPFQPRLLVLVDGRQVFIDDYSRTIWDNIPVNIDDIRQIEVVKGASSALFGSNAAGGVVNIVTYSPLYDKNNVANISFGTQSTATTDATVTANGSWGGTKFSAGGVNGKEFNTARSPFDQDASTLFDPKHRYFVNSSVLQLNKSTDINTEVTFSDSVGNTIDGVGRVTAGQKTETYSARVGADWQSPYGLISNTNYFNHSLASLYEIALEPAPFTFTIDMFVSQLQDEFKLGPDHTFRAAIEYQHKNHYGHSDAAIVSQNSDLAEDIYTASGTWLWKINDKISWTNAARFDHQQMAQNGTLAPGNDFSSADYSHVNNVWSANSDINYQATELDKFRVGYGRGVQLPSMLQSGFNNIGNFSGIPGANEGNPKLKPTIVQDIEIDYERKIEPVFSTLKLSTYYEFNQDITGSPATPFSIQPVFGVPTFVFMNLGSSQGWGGEVELKGSHPNGYHWDASYSLSKVVDSSSVASLVDYQRSAPENHFRLLGGYASGAWEFDMNGQYLSSTDMIRSPDGGASFPAIYVGGYASIGARIGYNINDNLVLALSGINLNRADTQESPYAAVQRQVFLGLTGRF